MAKIKVISCVVKISIEYFKKLWITKIIYTREFHPKPVYPELSLPRV